MVLVPPKMQIRLTSTGKLTESPSMKLSNSTDQRSTSSTWAPTPSPTSKNKPAPPTAPNTPQNGSRPNASKRNTATCVYKSWHNTNPTPKSATSKSAAYGGKGCLNIGQMMRPANSVRVRLHLIGSDTLPIELSMTNTTVRETPKHGPRIHHRLEYWPDTDKNNTTATDANHRGRYCSRQRHWIHTVPSHNLGPRLRGTSLLGPVPAFHSTSRRNEKRRRLRFPPQRHRRRLPDEP